MNKLAFILFFFIFSCKSESEKNLEKFKETDASLKAIKPEGYRDIYERINSQRLQNEQLSLTADTLVLNLEKANDFIDSVIEVIKVNDSTGKETKVGKMLFRGTKPGNPFINQTNSLYRFAIQHLAYLFSKGKIENTFKKYRGLFGQPGFINSFIDKTPSIGVITILREVKADCTIGTLISLRDIEIRLRK